MKKLKLLSGAYVFMALALLFNACQSFENEFEYDLISLKSAEILHVNGDAFLSPVKFIRAKGNPYVEARLLDENSVENFSSDFILYLQNGDETGNRVSSAIVKLDGKQLFGPSDFSQQVDLLSVSVSGITAESVLEVEVRGEPGGFIQIWIEGTLIEIKDTYKMYFISRTNGLLYGVLPDDNYSALHQFDGTIQKIQTYNQKLFVLEINFATNIRSIQVLDYDGNKIETLNFPAEVTMPSGFNILPDGRFAIYNNVNNLIYFLNPDFTFITQVSFPISPFQQNMKGVVVGNDLIISENGYKGVLKVDLASYEISIFRNFSHLTDQWIGAITFANDTYYLCSPYNVFSFKPGEAEKLVVTLPTNNNVAIEIDGNHAYVGSNFGGKIYKIDLTNGSYSDYIVGVPQISDILILR